MITRVTAKGMELTESEQFALGRDYSAAVAEAMRAMHAECGAGSMAFSGGDERREIEAKLRQHFALAAADESVVLRSFYVARCFADSAAAHDFDALVQALIDDGDDVSALPGITVWQSPGSWQTTRARGYGSANNPAEPDQWGANAI